MINLDEAYLAYQKVIDGDTSLTEDLEEDHDVYSGIEKLNHYDLGVLAEDIVEHLLYEDYDLNDIQEQFLESLNESFDYNKNILNEASVYNTPTVRDDSKVKLNVPSRKQIDKGYKADAKKAYDSKTKVIRTRIKAKKAAKRAENIQKLKSTVKDTISKVKTGANRVSDSAKNAASRGMNAARGGVAAVKTNSDKFQSKVRGVGSKVKALGGKIASDIKSRIVNKAKSVGDSVRSGVNSARGSVAGGLRRAASAARGAASKIEPKATPSPERPSSPYRNSGAGTKEKVSSGGSSSSSSSGVRALPPVGKTKSGKTLTQSQRAMQTAGQNRRLKSRLGEDIDLFDYISDFLISEGYADTIEDAEYIMANQLTEDQIESILDEGFVKFPTEKVVAKASKLINTDPKNKKDAKKTKARLGKIANAYALNAGYEIVADYLMSEGYADDLEDVDYLIDNELTDDQIEAILEANEPIMSVRSPSGKERSKIRKGAWGPSDTHRHESPAQIKSRGFSQMLKDREKAKKNAGREGRVRVADKKSITKLNAKYDDKGYDVPHKSDDFGYGERKNTVDDYKRRQARKSGR